MQITKAVKNPKKQRKQLFNAPAHQRHKLMAARLSPEQIASKGVKTLPVRKGDTIRVMRGDHKGFEGKISRVDLKSFRIYVEGLTREKVDGTTIFVSIHPSKVMIKNVGLDDKWRKAVVERKQALLKKEEKKVAKKVPEKVAAKVEKPVEKAAKAVVAKAKVPTKIKEEKPAEVPLRPVEAKAKAPAKVKEEKPLEKKVAPVEAIKPAEAKAEIPVKAMVEKKPAKKKPAATTAKKPAAAPAEKKEEKPAEEAKAAEKKPKAPAKKTPLKKAPAAKSKAKAEKEGGT